MTTQKQMYGVTEAQVLRDYREAERIYGKYMNLYIMAILSDAQHMIEYRKLKTAKEFLATCRPPNINLNLDKLPPQKIQGKLFRSSVNSAYGSDRDVLQMASVNKCPVYCSKDKL